MKLQITLRNVLSQRICDPVKGWIDAKIELTKQQKAELLDIFGKGCRHETKLRLERCLDDNCRRVKPCGIINRVHLDDNGASYCAGQDYPYEVGIVRKTLIASY